MNYHKLGALKQQICFVIVLQARSLKSRCQHGCTPYLPRLQGRNVFLVYCSFQWLLTCLVATLLCFHITFSSVSTLCVSGHLSLELRPTRIIQGDLLSRSLIISAKTLFPNNLTFIGSGAQDMNITFQWPPFSPPQVPTHSENKYQV